MHEKKGELVELFAAIPFDETSLIDSVKGVSLFRIETSFPRSPFAYNSEIIILAQGEKWAYLGNEVYAYDSSHYLVLPVPLPVDCEGRAEPAKPIFGLRIAIDPIEVGEILLEMEDMQREPDVLPKGIYCAPMSETLYDATVRLLRAIANPPDARILAPMIRREIIYRVLQDERGEVLQSLAHRNRRFFQIAKVLLKIHESYSNDFDIERLARESGMSSSAFYNNFKAVTATSPLQYIKNIRLHKARSFMIQEGLSASMAAMRVGYESPSQFNREYRRLFGVTPARDVTVLR